MDFEKITNVQVGGIDTKDYPDFVDAYIESCDIDGNPATDAELEIINDATDFVHEKVFEHLT